MTAILGRSIPTRNLKLAPESALDGGSREYHYYHFMIRNLSYGPPQRLCRARLCCARLGSIAIAIALCQFSAVGRAAEPDQENRGEPSLDGVYYDWSLYRLEENGNPVCYLASGLERSSDVVPRRRPAVVLITNRPVEGKKGVVSVNPGYTYDDGASVLMTIGRRQFHLFTAGSAAWAQDADDLQIIAAIRGGSTVVVTGRMKGGPTTTDIFSLKGFGPALLALDHACPMPGSPVSPQHSSRRKRRSKA